MYLDLCLWVLSKLCQYSWIPKFKKSLLQMCSKIRGSGVSRISNVAHSVMWMPNASVSNLFVFLFSTNLFEALLCRNVCMYSPFLVVVVTCVSELYFWIAFSAQHILRYKYPVLWPLFFCEAGKLESILWCKNMREKLMFLMWK